MNIPHSAIEATDNKIHFIRSHLSEMTEEEIETLILALPMEQVELLTPPETGLIMARVNDCFDTDFYLGEVLVTRTEVNYGDHRAQSTIMGNLPKHAIVAATLDVLRLSGESNTIENAANACAPAMDRIGMKQRLDARLVAATRVQFESMAEEE
jgi:phosphonate C-P lyase system protein PhnG